MAPIPSNKLTLLPFPQRWESGTLALNLVVLPRGDPLQPLMTGIPATPDGPAFANASLQPQALLIPGLDQLPDPANVTAEVSLALPPPNNARELFEEISTQFDIDPSLEPTDDPRFPGRQFKKLLVSSYRNAFAFPGPRTPFAVMDDSYACALRDSCRLEKPPGPPPTTKTVWGRIIARALRQPLLARRLGLLYTVDVVPPQPAFFEDGGWLYLGLEPSSDYAPQVTAKPELLSVYAARIPSLGAVARSLFAAVLFPVSSAPPAGNFDELFREVAAYDDGFAKIVHSAQQTTADPVGLEDADSLPPVVDTGVQLGWDDEQILIWMNRQITDPTVETRDAPMGVMGYRVDAREEGSVQWLSLMQAKAELEVGDIGIGTFDGELTVEVGPLQLDNQEGGDYWMPTYFTQWEGRSLVTADSVGLRLSGVSRDDARDSYMPVDDDQLPLRYGKTYEFRVRLADISGGGPAAEEDPVNPAPAPVSACRFRRHVRPLEVRIEEVPEVVDPTDPPDSLTVRRPRLAYPAAVFAGIPNAQTALLDDLQSIFDDVEAGGIGREPGLPDPDVATVEIRVQVFGLELDPANTYAGPPPLRTVYTTERDFPAGDPSAPIVLQLDYQDVKDIETMAAAAAGPLPLPRARDVVLTFTPMGRDDPGLTYFGSEEARIGRPADVFLRGAPSDERDLLVPDVEANRLRAILIQPDEAETPSLYAMQLAAGKGEEADTDVMHRLAAELDLDVNGLTLMGRPGRRTIFGCSGAIPHVLAPDASAITFASKADLVLQWITAITIGLDRDWTWDGAADVVLQVSRDGGPPIGTVRLPKSLNPTVFEGPIAAGREPDRSTTDIIFLDVVDPKPDPPKHPHEMQVSYTLAPRFRHVPLHEDDPLDLTVDLPMAAPPAQTPKILSAGIALSPYVREPDYSSSEPRQRCLWLELDRSVDNPQDTYFARVLSYAPDPMLTKGEDVSPPPEPPLPVDPEFIRVIRPGQSDDRAGLNAMQQLIPTESPRHFLIPLPPGLNRRSRELFGFFVYELRVGHLKGWSTAQARFGPALRVTGVQHPAPTLLCQAFRTPQEVVASAAYATPVFNGRSLRPIVPASELWVVLYTQVVQADGKDYRNILLGRRQAWPDERKLEMGGGTELHGSVAWSQAEIEAALEAYALPMDSPLSVLAIELLPEPKHISDPVGADLGEVRILRTSPLTRVPAVCIQPPCPP